MDNRLNRAPGFPPGPSGAPRLLPRSVRTPLPSPEARFVPRPPAGPPPPGCRPLRPRLPAASPSRIGIGSVKHFINPEAPPTGHIRPSGIFSNLSIAGNDMSQSKDYGLQYSANRKQKEVSGTVDTNKCSICKIDFENTQKFIVHLNSILHKQNVQKFESNKSSTQQTKTYNPWDNDSDMKNNDRSNIKKISSRRHSKEENEDDDESIRCDLCKIDFETYSKRNFHLRSILHTQNCQRLEREEKENEEKRLQEIDSQKSVEIDDTYSHSQDKDSDDQTSYGRTKCDACQIEFNHRVDYEFHITTSSHKDNMHLLRNIEPYVSKSDVNQEEKIEGMHLNNRDHSVYLEDELYDDNEQNLPTATLNQYQIEDISTDTHSANQDCDEDEENTSYCQTCDMKFSKSDSYYAHVRGVSHYQNVLFSKSNKTSDANSTTAAAPSSYPKPAKIKEVVMDKEDKVVKVAANEDWTYCEQCDLGFQSSKSFGAHLTGNFHRNTLKALGIEVEEIEEIPEESKKKKVPTATLR